MNGVNYFLAVVDVDVTKQRKAQQTHRLLPVYEQNHARFPFTLNKGDQPLPRCFQQRLFDHRLKCRKHEKQPENIHFLSPPRSARSRLPRPLETVFVRLCWPSPPHKQPAQQHSSHKSTNVRPPCDAANTLRARQCQRSAEQLTEEPESQI